MKTLLIIGGSKFIGKSFVNYFNQFNKFKKLKIKIISRRKINIKNKKNISIIVKKFEKLQKLPKCEYILYCLRSDTVKNDYKLFKIFEKKLVILKKKPKIIFTSSGVLYGNNPKKIKIRENRIIKSKNSAIFQAYKKKWFIQKLNLEKNFYNLSKKNYKILILRMFSFIGPSLLNQTYAPSIFIKSIKKSKKINIKGSLNNYRSYLHEKDMVEWIITLFFRFKKNYDILNFGSDKAISIYQLAKLIAKKFAKKEIILLNKSKKLDYYVPSIGKLKKNFKLKINVSLSNAIKDSIK